MSQVKEMTVEQFIQTLEALRVDCSSDNEFKICMPEYLFDEVAFGGNYTSPRIASIEHDKSDNSVAITAIA